MDLKLPRARHPITSNANSSGMPVSGSNKLSKSLTDAVEVRRLYHAYTCTIITINMPSFN